MLFLCVLLTVPSCTRDVNSQLIEAAANGKTERVKSLLDAGADAEAKDNDGMTALLAAVDEGHWETVRVLLDAGADANAKSEDGISALLAATYAGHTQTVKALLDAGAEVDAKDSDGWTALMQVTNGGTEIVQVLLDAGADLEPKANSGVTPLMSALAFNDTEIVQILMEAGADVNAKTSDGVNALMMAVATSEPGPTQFSRTDNVRALLDAGADVNAKNDNDFSALIHAEEKGRTKLAELLRKAGANWGQEEIDFLRQRLETLQADASSALPTVRNIEVAQIYHSATDEEGQYAKNLLRLKEDGLYALQLADNGRQDGYEFKTSGQGETFTVNADPIVPGETGTVHFFVDESGVIRWSMEDPATVFSTRYRESEADAEQSL